MYTIIILNILIFSILFIFLVLAVRAYQIKMRLTYPIRHALEASDSEGTDDYQNIFSMFITLSSMLKKRVISKGLMGKIWSWFLNSNFIRILTFRPLTYDFTKLHLTYAFANLSEISRDRFRTNKELTKSLKHIFSDLNDSIISENHEKYCAILAQYYRLLRSPDKYLCDPISSIYFIKKQPNDEFVELLDQVQSCLEENDTFEAYNYIIALKNDDLFNRLNDYEMLAYYYLSSKLECFIQGTRYFIRRDAIKRQLDEIKSHCKDLKRALSKNNPTKILKAAA